MGLLLAYILLDIKIKKNHFILYWKFVQYNSHHYEPFNSPIGGFDDTEKGTLRFVAKIIYMYYFLIKIEMRYYNTF